LELFLAAISVLVVISARLDGPVCKASANHCFRIPAATPLVAVAPRGAGPGVGVPRLARPSLMDVLYLAAEVVRQTALVLDHVVMMPMARSTVSAGRSKTKGVVHSALLTLKAPEKPLMDAVV